VMPAMSTCHASPLLETSVAHLHRSASILPLQRLVVLMRTPAQVLYILMTRLRLPRRRRHHRHRRHSRRCQSPLHRVRRPRQQQLPHPPSRQRTDRSAVTSLTVTLLRATTPLPLLLQRRRPSHYNHHPHHRHRPPHHHHRHPRRRRLHHQHCSPTGQ